VAKDQDSIEVAFDKLMYYLSKFNSHIKKATAEAAPTQHSIAEAKYVQDLENPFGGIAVWQHCGSSSHAPLKSMSKSKLVPC